MCSIIASVFPTSNSTVRYYVLRNNGVTTITTVSTTYSNQFTKNYWTFKIHSYLFDSKHILETKQSTMPNLPLILLLQFDEYGESSADTFGTHVKQHSTKGLCTCFMDGSNYLLKRRMREDLSKVRLGLVEPPVSDRVPKHLSRDKA